jgi:hypothetical protein
MAWKYAVVAHTLTSPDGKTSWSDCVYSGHGPGLNNPAMEADVGVGPIPVGHWEIGAALNPPDHLGPVAMPLIPDGFDPHGRSAFFMHGDYAGDVSQNASHGCIVAPREAREAVDASNDCDLEVVP